MLVCIAYNFVWAVCKIVFGVIYGSYFFCISGASTLTIGFSKKIYLTNFKSDDLKLKTTKSINISILLILSGLLFCFYMSRLFFISENIQYGLILSIAIATFSFVKFSIAICNFFKAKKTNDILFQSFKGCSLASSCFAID